MVPGGPSTGEPPVFLVLVEVLNRDPEHRYPAQVFPFARGLDAPDGGLAAWWRLGTDADPADLAPRLGDDERRLLLRRLETAHPTHVCLNVPPDEELRLGLERMDPAPRVRVLNEGDRKSVV